MKKLSKKIHLSPVGDNSKSKYILKFINLIFHLSNLGSLKSINYFIFNLNKN